MTHDQIVNLLISLGSGTLLLIAAKALGPLFKKISERMNRPSPLTPQSKGQLVTAIAQSETELERLRYHESCHLKLNEDQKLSMRTQGICLLLPPRCCTCFQSRL